MWRKSLIIWARNGHQRFVQFFFSEVKMLGTPEIYYMGELLLVNWRPDAEIWEAVSTTGKRWTAHKIGHLKTRIELSEVQLRNDVLLEQNTKLIACLKECAVIIPGETAIANARRLLSRIE